MHIQRLTSSHAPVFLVNSRYPLFCATPNSSRSKSFHHRGSPLNRRNGSNLPSSLTRIRSIASVYSTRPPVSVWGTGGKQPRAEAFLDGRDHRIRAQRRPSSHLGLMPPGFAWGTACVLDHGKPPPRPATRPCHSSRYPTTATVPTPPRSEPRREHHATTEVSARCLGSGGCKPVREYRPVHPFDYACRPRLRTRLTQGR